MNKIKRARMTVYQKRSASITFVLILLAAILLLSSYHAPKILAQTTPNTTVMTSSTGVGITPTSEAKQEPDLSGGIILSGVLLLSVIILGTISATFRMYKRPHRK